MFFLQETVVALQAMALFASLFPFRDQNEVTITISGGDNFGQSMTINQDNADQMHEIQARLNVALFWDMYFLKQK